MPKIIAFKPTLSPEEYISYVTDRFTAVADPLRAEKQMAYMRHQFEYCGLGATVWYPMIQQIFREHGMYSGKDLKQYIALAYDQPYREVLYTGIEMMQRMLPEQPKSFIRTLESCITTHSWWDSVDWLAKLVGIYFRLYPEQQIPYCEKWIASDNMWLQRAAIIHQLHYKKDTDHQLLFDLIKKQSHNQEFFIRKACGWALRQYSRVNPKAVKAFVRSNKLSTLTQKEALRLMKS